LPLLLAALFLAPIPFLAPILIFALIVVYSIQRPTPNARSFLASPVQISMGRSNFRSTPERLHHSGRLLLDSGSGSSSGGVGSTSEMLVTPS
jgi:hypothetical protein